MRAFGGNGFTHNAFFAPKRGMFHAGPGYPKSIRTNSILRR
jgi:hypothetical protein